MNKSERIRSLINEPMTSAEISESIDVRVKLVRGLIQTMLRLGIVTQIGDKRPYKYQVARELKEQNRGFGLKSNTSQNIRNTLKIQELTPAQIASKLSLKTDNVYQHMRDMIHSGYIAKNEDGTYQWIKDPAPPMTEQERLAKRRERDRLKRAAHASTPRPKVRHERMVPITIKKPVEDANGKPAQTVDEWLAEGGKIDRSPTPVRFERLTKQDIASHDYRGRPSAVQRVARSYLAG